LYTDRERDRHGESYRRISATFLFMTDKFVVMINVRTRFELVVLVFARPKAFKRPAIIIGACLMPRDIAEEVLMLYLYTHRLGNF
jgi:hypothetical protein